jgi:hypothetical protein
MTATQTARRTNVELMRPRRWHTIPINGFRQTEAADYAEGLRRTAEGAEGPAEQRARLRRRFAARPQNKAPRVAELYREYEERTGARIGCD